MFCPHCGAQRTTKSAKCEACGATATQRRLLFILAAATGAVVLLALASLVGRHYLAVARLNERLEEAVGRDSGYTETILRIEAEAGSMTYMELFSVCEKSIADRTNLIVELRGLYPAINSEVKLALIDHLTAENELIRQKVAFYRQQLALSSALKLYSNHLGDTPSSSYGWDYFLARSKDLKNEATEAATKMVTEGTEFVKTYETLVDREKLLGEQMDRASLRFVRVFEKYKSQNLEKAEEAISTAKALRI